MKLWPVNRIVLVRRAQGQLSATKEHYGRTKLQRSGNSQSEAMSGLILCGVPKSRHHKVIRPQLTFGDPMSL